MRSIKINDHLVVDTECDDAQKITVSGDLLLWYDKDFHTQHYDLPPNHTYTLIGKCSDLTEEQAQKLVFKEAGMGVDYIICDSTAVQSLSGLCRRNNFNPETSVIIKIEKDGMSGK